MDIRYWNKQRSSKEIRASMHRLIELNLNGADKDTKAVKRPRLRNKASQHSTNPKKGTSSPGKEIDSSKHDATVENKADDGDGDGEDSDGGVDNSNDHKSKKKSKPKAAAVARSKTSATIIGTRKNKLPARKDADLDLTDRGLVGWWTFEDGWKGGGKGGDRATDVTEHRFKTLILRDINKQLSFPGVRDLFSIAPPLIDGIRPVTPISATVAVDQAPTDEGIKPKDHFVDGFRPFDSPVGGTRSPTPVEDLESRPHSRADAEPVPQAGALAPTTTLPAVDSSGTELSLADRKRLARDLAKVHAIVDAGVRRSRKLGYAWIDTECMPCDEKQIKVLSAAEKIVAATAAASVNAIEAVAPVPLPSFRLKNVCPYELRRFRLAQAGRALQKEVVCPMGK